MRRRAKPLEPVAPRPDDGLVLVYVLTWYQTRGIVTLYARLDPEFRGFASFQGPDGGWVRKHDIFQDKATAAAEAHRRLSEDIATCEQKTLRLKYRRRRLFARPGEFGPKSTS